MEKKIVFLETWTESERGWGTRPDGCSLHVSRADYESYVKEYWDGMPDEVQDEYTRPDGGVTPVEVSDELHLQLSQSKNGIRLWQGAYRDALNNGEIKKL